MTTSDRDTALGNNTGGAQNGTWTLRIVDDATGDIGTVHCFKLRIRRAA